MAAGEPGWEDVRATQGSPEQPSTSSRPSGGWTLRFRPGSTSGAAPAPDAPPQPHPHPPPPPPPPPRPSLAAALARILARLHDAAAATTSAAARLRAAVEDAAARAGARLARLVAPSVRLPVMIAGAASLGFLGLAVHHGRVLRALRDSRKDSRALAAALAALHHAVATASSGATGGGGALHPLLAAAGYTPDGLAAVAKSGGTGGALDMAGVVLSEIAQAAG